MKYLKQNDGTFLRLPDWADDIESPLELPLEPASPSEIAAYMEARRGLVPPELTAAEQREAALPPLKDLQAVEEAEQRFPIKEAKETKK
jgi:hypothetical protein